MCSGDATNVEGVDHKYVGRRRQSYKTDAEKIHESNSTTCPNTSKIFCTKGNCNISCTLPMVTQELGTLIFQNHLLKHYKF